ncbi:MAG: hypothetical protein K6G08_03315 [Prevotella sp.]|nr:hypothetical protein [Prevotella sp.]
MGAKADWVEDYKIDYSQNTGFPFYVMGYVPEWVDGVMTDYGAMFKYVEVTEDAEETSDVIVKTQGGVEYYKIELAEPEWHQYFIADGIPTELDGTYTVKAMVKASEAVTININMGWGWSDGQSKGASVSIGTEWEEVEWEYSGIGGTSCNLVAQPGTTTATIEWKSLTVSHNQKESRPVTWQQWLTNDGKSIIPGVETESKYMGDAEFGEWPAWSLELTDNINANWRGNRTGEICAWALTMGRNFDDQNTTISEDSPRARPFPADIEAEAGNESNHLFAVHVTQIDAIDSEDSKAWSNQFWIQSPQGWKNGTKVRVKFRYKAEHACSVATQIHKEHPSDYLHYDSGIGGDINFTTEWQEFNKEVDFSDARATGWSLAFNLCSDATNGRTPNVFYFDDLSWETMVLDEGFFVAGCNTTTGLEYDFDNAIQFEEDPGEAGVFIATVGEKDAYVDQVMISTIRGNDAAFKGATLKPSGTISNDPDEWLGYTEASLAKLTLPGEGIWKIWIDTNYTAMAFEMIEGNAKNPVAIVTNETVVTVNGVEREPTASEQPKDEEAGIAEGTGQVWDNQFFLVANRVLEAGEETVVEFKYKANKEAKTSTQTHAQPGGYIHWAAIGDVNFTEEWQDFKYEYTIPSEAAGKSAQSIAFNMAEIKEACDYELKDFKWYLKADLEEGYTWENLINAEGTENFFVKEGAGTDPYEFGTDPEGISSVVNRSIVPAVTYNLAGQRVAKDYKGIVVKNGSKYIVK